MKMPKIPYIGALGRSLAPVLGPLGTGAGVAFAAPAVVDAGTEMADKLIPAVGTRRWQKIINAKVAANEARAVPDFLRELDVFQDMDFAKEMATTPRYSREGVNDVSDAVRDNQLMSYLASAHQRELQQVAARANPDLTGSMISRIMQGYQPPELL